MNQKTSLNWRVWFKKQLNPILSLNEPQEQKSISSLKELINFRKIDFLILSFFLVIALIIFLTQMRGNYPNALIGGDGANIASFAAAYDHPDYFIKDELLGNPANFQIYSTIHIPLLRFFNQFLGSYSLALIALVIPHVFIHLIGYYLLGRMLFRSRWWSLLLALIAAIPVFINLGEFWGIGFAIPRFTYQSLLPYLLCLALLWKNNPARWPWLMIISGLMVFIHAPSALLWGFCLWLGFWVFLPKNWKLRQKIAKMLLLGLLFLLVISPDIWIYLGNHQQGSSPNYEFVIFILNTFFAPDLLKAPAIFIEFIRLTWFMLLLPCALIAMIILLKSRKYRDDHFKLLIFWAAGIFIFSIVFPTLEQLIERTYKILPVEVDFVRGIRFFIPVMLIICIFLLVDLQNISKTRLLKIILPILGLFLLIGWGVIQSVNLQPIRDSLICMIKRGVDNCLTNSPDLQYIDAIRKLTPDGASFLPYSWNSTGSNEFLEIRYLALHPLVYHFKDRSFLTYSNQQELKHWYDIYMSIQHIEETAINPCDQIKLLKALSNSLNADYLIINSNGIDLSSCLKPNDILYHQGNLLII